jgi:hypothetical protein
VISKTWWVAWGDVARRLFALAASFASLVGVLVSLVPKGATWPWWAYTLLVASVGFLAVLVFLELAGRRGRTVCSTKDTSAIRKYMHDWIEHGGRVAIWTRDMSWAQNIETRQLLVAKAARSELILCLPQMSELSRELRDAGAEVCVYGSDLLEAPASRFTITFVGRDGSRVAVGRAEGNTHVIDEFTSGEHPAFYLASDLIALARGLLRKGR